MGRMLITQKSTKSAKYNKQKAAPSSLHRMSEKLLDSRDSVVDYNFDDVTADDGVDEKPVRVFGSRFDSVDFVA